MPSDRQNLENLVRARQLNVEAPDPREVANLIASAEARLRDAARRELSADSRFLLAYEASHGLALAALRDAGYRPSSSGHRQVLFQVLEFTAGASTRLWQALAQYHDRRNKVQYEGAVAVSGTEAGDLLKLANELRDLVRKKAR
jgi:hypothetical protein